MSSPPYFLRVIDYPLTIATMMITIGGIIFENYALCQCNDLLIMLCILVHLAGQ